MAMNVLINCLSAVSGGAVSYLSNLMPKLVGLFEESDRGHEIKILAHREQRMLFPSIPASQCILISNRRPKGGYRFLWEFCNIGGIVRRHNIDVLFAPYQISPQIRGVKQVLMLRNMDPFCFNSYKYSFKPWLRNNLLALQSRRSLHCADRIIAVSDYVKTVLVDHLNIPEDRIRRIYHGRDTNFSPCGGKESDIILLGKTGVRGPYILTCGSLWPYRRCEDVVKAFNSFTNNNRTDISLVIAGAKMYAPYRRFIESLISESPAQRQIHLVGHVPYETMRALYRHCTLCVFATEVEACPNIAIEAMTSGCAIISSDQPPLPEIFGSCALEFGSRDVEALTLKMHSVMSDKRLLDSLKEQALKRAPFFSWDRCAKQTYSALVRWDDK